MSQGRQPAPTAKKATPFPEMPQCIKQAEVSSSLGIDGTASPADADSLFFHRRSDPDKLPTVDHAGA
jgi:hypothetical protein